MRRTCLANAAIFLGLAAGYAALVLRSGALPPVGALVIALFCAIGSGLVLALSAGCWRVARCRLALDRAERNLPLRDGRFEAVAGPIAPRDEALISPLFRRRCVIYSYEVHRFVLRRNRRSRRLYDYSGIGMAPAAVESPRGNVGIVGMPALEQVGEEQASFSQLAPEARRYFKETEFIALPRSPASLGAFDRAFGEGAAALRYDWKIGDNPNLAQATLAERSVAAGAAVCVFGRYSAASGAIGRGRRLALFDSAGLEVVPGSIAEVRRRLARSLIVAAPVPLFLFAFTHGMLALVLLLGTGR